MRVPDYCEPIIAWRAWFVRKDGVLRGQYVTEAWVPREAMRAHCRERGGTHVVDGKYQHAPLQTCTCGIYAHKTERQAQSRTGLNTFTWEGPQDSVWGSVKLWGRVLQYANGYRAEFAYPHALKTSNRRLVDVMSGLYGVPVTFEAKPEPKADDDYTVPSYGWTTVAYNQPTYYYTQAPIGIVTSVSPLDPSNAPTMLWTPPQQDDQQPLVRPLSAAREKRLTKLFNLLAGSGNKKGA